MTLLCTGAGLDLWKSLLWLYNTANQKTWELEQWFIAALCAPLIKTFWLFMGLTQPKQLKHVNYRRNHCMLQCWQHTPQLSIAQNVFHGAPPCWVRAGLLLQLLPEPQFCSTRLVGLLYYARMHGVVHYHTTTIRSLILLWLKKKKKGEYLQCLLLSGIRRTPSGRAVSLLLH